VFGPGTEGGGILIGAGVCGFTIRHNRLEPHSGYAIQDENPTCCNSYSNNTFGGKPTSGPSGCIQ
jgi:hypothetical protein